MHKEWIIFGEINSNKGMDAQLLATLSSPNSKNKPPNQITQAIVHRYTFISSLNSIELLQFNDTLKSHTVCTLIDTSH